MYIRKEFYISERQVIVQHVLASVGGGATWVKSEGYKVMSSIVADQKHPRI